MSNDLLMLRGEQDGSYNLAVGEPVFLQDAAFWCGPRAMPYADPRYPPYGGDPALIEKIRENLKHAKKHIVITNGAKQAILAAFYSYHKRSFQNKTSVVLPEPYWPSYPTLATLSNLYQVAPYEVYGQKEFGYSRYLHVATSPNNPDGSETIGDTDIWDAAYFHWLYGAKAVPNATVSIWSAAKMLGLSGVRVGVLTTDDDELAELARQYVEKTTSGVANDSQKRLFDALDSMSVSKDRVAESYAHARRTLLKNGEIFGNSLANFVTEMHGVPTTGRGMFVWFKAVKDRFDAACTAANVKVIPGSACGFQERNGMAWYRMSMGHRNEYTAKACLRIASAL